MAGRRIGAPFTPPPCVRPSTGRIRNVPVQAPALKAVVRHAKELAGHVLPPGPALRLLDGYLQLLASLHEPPPTDLAAIVSAHLLDLVAAAIGPIDDAREYAKKIVAKRGVKAARLQAILGEIARRSSDPRFDLDNAAVTLGLSRRYVQKLLKETGKSFTEHLTESRLDRAHAMLTDPRHRRATIIDIAFAAGFGDISNFNRLFRRRYGVTPSGVRAAAIHSTQE